MRSLHVKQEDDKKGGNNLPGEKFALFNLFAAGYQPMVLRFLRFLSESPLLRNGTLGQHPSHYLIRMFVLTNHSVLGPGSVSLVENGGTRMF